MVLGRDQMDKRVDSARQKHKREDARTRPIGQVCWWSEVQLSGDTVEGHTTAVQAKESKRLGEFTNQ